mgnify:CR=1 FL=1
MQITSRSSTAPYSAVRYPDIKVQTGVPIKWIINAPKGSLNGCNYRMLLRSFGIEHTLSEGEKCDRIYSF